jgi:hypothetical protein
VVFYLVPPFGELFNKKEAPILGVQSILEASLKYK